MPLYKSDNFVHMSVSSLLMFFYIFPEFFPEGSTSFTSYAVQILSFFLSLAPQPSLGLGLLHKIGLNFLEASQ
jgi:hypothetical protein